MNKLSDLPILGKRFIDNGGRHWSVDDVVPMCGRADQYHVVRVSFRQPGGTQGRLTMSGHEFATVARAGKWQPLER